jgi:acetylornithine deacetylase/succinyl-diaminopimelate desuccinylase-like protein
MDLTVHLPNPFHGLLTVTATQGNLTYLAAPNSPGAVLNVGTGDVDVENVGNQLTIQVGTGNIVLVTAGTLSGPDSSGNPQPPSLVTTNYGNITAKIPDAASLTINARTVKNGVVRAQADQVVVQQAPDGKSAQITIGDGMSGVINMGTGDGDIVFLRP